MSGGVGGCCVYQRGFFVFCFSLGGGINGRKGKRGQEAGSLVPSTCARGSRRQVKHISLQGRRVAFHRGLFRVAGAAERPAAFHYLWRQHE